MKKALIALMIVSLTSITFADPSVSYRTATNIAQRVTSNIVNKAYVEGLGLSSMTTNEVEDIANHAISTNGVLNNADYQSVRTKALNSAQYHEYGYPFLGRQDLMVKDAMVVGTTNYAQRSQHTEYCDGSIQNEAMDCYLYLPYGRSGDIAVEDPFGMSRLLAMAETNETAKADICEKLCDIGVNDIKDETSNVVYRLEADGTRFYFRPIRPISMED